MKRISEKISEEFNHPGFADKLKSGNETTYRALVNGFMPWAMNFVKKRYRLQNEDAKDIIQSFSQRTFERIDSFDPVQGQFVVWAFQILRNLTVDWLRRYKKLELISIASLKAGQTFSSAVSDETATLYQDDLSPLEKLPMKIRQAILKLNDRYQQLLGLMLLGTHDQVIREIMGIASDGALWTLRSRVIAKLKEELEKSHSPEEVSHE